MPPAALALLRRDPCEASIGRRRQRALSWRQLLAEPCLSDGCPGKGALASEALAGSGWSCEYFWLPACPPAYLHRVHVMMLIYVCMNIWHHTGAVWQSGAVQVATLGKTVQRSLCSRGAYRPLDSFAVPSPARLAERRLAGFSLPRLAWIFSASYASAPGKRWLGIPCRIPLQSRLPTV